MASSVKEKNPTKELSVDMEVELFRLLLQLNSVNSTQSTKSSIVMKIVTSDGVAETISLSGESSFKCKAPVSKPLPPIPSLPARRKGSRMTKLQHRQEPSALAVSARRQEPSALAVSARRQEPSAFSSKKRRIKSSNDVQLKSVSKRKNRDGLNTRDKAKGKDPSDSSIYESFSIPVVSIPTVPIHKCISMPSLNSSVNTSPERPYISSSKRSYSKIDLASKAKIDSPCPRCGVIPVTYFKGRLSFCLGIDSTHLDYTDFGGGFSKKRDRTVVRAAFRELQEESLEVFKIRKSDLDRSICIYDKNNLIIFMLIDEKTAIEAVSEFNFKIKRASDPEVKRIEWLTYNSMVKKIREGRFYSRVKSVISERLPEIKDELDMRFLYKGTSFRRGRTRRYPKR